MRKFHSFIFLVLLAFFPLSLQAADLTEAERNAVENLVEKADAPPPGTVEERGPNETTYPFPDDGANVAKPNTPPGEDHTTHIIEKSDGTYVRVFDDYIEVGDANGTHVYDRSTGKLIWEDPPLPDNGSILDDLAGTPEEEARDWVDRFKQGGMTEEELRKRLHARGFGYDTTAGKAQPLTDEELRQRASEREESRRLRREQRTRYKEEERKKKEAAEKASSQQTQVSVQ